MADTKISALPASTTPLAGTEVLPIVQSGATKQVSVANLTAGRATSASEFVVGTAGKGVTGVGGAFLQNYGLVAAAGSLDLPIDINGFVGTLSVSATRGNYNLQSTRTVFAVSCFGTTLTTTSLHTQDGSAGSNSFSVTCPSAGVIRVTDTSGYGSDTAIYIAFHGAFNYLYA